MTQAINTKLSFVGIIGTLALAMTLLAAPASFAGERGDRWERDRSPRIERHYDRDRHHRGRRSVGPAHRRAHRYEHHHAQDNFLGPVAVGIGLGILTYAIIDSHRRY